MAATSRDLTALSMRGIVQYVEKETRKLVETKFSDEVDEADQSTSTAAKVLALDIEDRPNARVDFCHQGL